MFAPWSLTFPAISLIVEYSWGTPLIILVFNPFRWSFPEICYWPCLLNFSLFDLEEKDLFQTMPREMVDWSKQEVLSQEDDLCSGKIMRSMIDMTDNRKRRQSVRACMRAYTHAIYYSGLQVPLTDI